LVLWRDDEAMKTLNREDVQGRGSIVALARSMRDDGGMAHNVNFHLILDLLCLLFLQLKEDAPKTIMLVPIVDGQEPNLLLGDGTQYQATAEGRRNASHLADGTSGLHSFISDEHIGDLATSQAICHSGTLEGDARRGNYEFTLGSYRHVLKAREQLCRSGKRTRRGREERCAV